MHIKKLVLKNFKSFGRSTELPFYDDFTTISGPNGSGKSNIIDAILFCLGLARTRGIRAQKLTDLIYNPGHEGAEDDPDRPREAIVEVTLDNSDETLTRAQIESAAGTTDIGETDEISIRRRVKRTDNNYYSYYYINDRSVNLSDIQDLLAQAGITPEGYNVVMQGDVTGIINMTPYRRREIIDEIAGVAEFDEKKEAAMAELDTVGERIDEAELRIEEKTDRLEQLADERETAIQYRDLRDERDEYEAFKRAAELEEKRSERNSLDEAIAELQSQLADEEETLDTAAGRVERLRDELTELNAEIERTGEDEQLRVKREIEEIKGEIDRLEDRIETATARIEEADADRRSAFVRIDQTQERIEELESDQRETKLEKARITSAITELENERSSLQTEIDETDSEYESLRDELTERRDALEAAKAEKNDLQREQDRLLDEARRRSEEIEELEADRSRIDGDQERIEQEIEELRRELERAAENNEQIESVIDDLKAERRELDEELESVESSISAAQQEYAQLEAQAEQSGDSSYGRAVTTILNADIGGVHGTVGQLGGVDQRYATACETAAGGRLAHVVVDSDEVGAHAIDYLKNRNAGRATFLPLTEIESRGRPSLPDHDGVIDFAYNLVDFSDEYAGIFSYVLGSTVVVDTLDTARDLMGSCRLVTLDGDLVETSGAMTGGSRGGSRYSFTKSGKGRLDRVAEQIQELEDTRRTLQSDRQDVLDRLESARDRKSNAVEQYRDIERTLDAKEEERTEVADRLETIEEQIEAKQSTREGVDERMQELAAEIEDVTDQITSIETDIDDVEADLAESKIPQLTNKIDEINDEIDEHESTIASLDAKLNEFQLEINYAESTIEELNEEIETAQNRKADEQDRIAEYEDAIEDRRDTLSEKHDTVAELEEELAELKDERSALEATIQEAIDERDAQRSTVDRLSTQLEAKEEALRALDKKIEELASEVETYDAADVPDHETVLSEIERLTAEMAALEPVNMLAIDEYEQVQADLETLEERRDILVAERNDILERIESYETQKRETFMEAFDGINEHFMDVFERLSDGSGRLHLENEEDPFEEGLTMEAQPADKPIQRLEAMSGGEKSLTALAFIFAVQRYNPAPFYALDEIDAFLDAVNADRVGEMVDDLASTAQFIVVSHRSALLERSDRAIGVTMQENNLSAVTGINLSDSGTEALADD